MKHYKNIEAFKARVSKSTDWADYFKLGGRMYEIYEYGGGFFKDPCYVYFRNKRTNDMIKIHYYLPHINYKNGKKVEEGEYEFLELEVLPENYLWR